MTRSGRTSSPPRWLVLAAAVALLPLLAACEAGDNSPTLQFHYPTDAAGTVVGQLSIRNVFVLGAPLGSSLSKGQSASLFLALINEGPADRLLSITAPGSAASVTLIPGSIDVKTNEPVLYIGPQPKAYLTDLTRTLTSGSDIKLVLHFANAGPVVLQVPVMPKATHYATYSPPPSPAPSGTPASAKRHRTGAASTPSPGTGSIATPSPTPTG